MAGKTKIEWADSTFNPWWGCRRVSAACDSCYAASWSARTGSVAWDSGEYRTFADRHWKGPVGWNAEAVRTGIGRRVFCASMGDVFDLEAPEAERARLWDLIRATPALVWMLLTKRPNVALKLLPADIAPKVWVGVTAETFDMWRLRVPLLRKIPAAVRFVSIEPLLGPMPLVPSDLRDIGWVIAGGETGRAARPMHPDWARGVRDVAKVAGVPFFFKQWGEHDAEGDRVGKVVASRFLDGLTWDEVPCARP